MLKAVDTAKSASADVEKEIPIQPVSLDIWDKKYRLKTKQGDNVDADMDASYSRVARALADVETTEEKRAEWHEKFLWALRRGAIPAGRITSNAGALEHKPATSTINCTVSGVISDSMDDILGKVHEAGLTLKAGMMFTIEPMINAGKRDIKQMPDGWTIVTKDRSLSAQWEHTILVTEHGFEVMTLSDGSPAAPGFITPL